MNDASDGIYDGVVSALALVLASAWASSGRREQSPSLFRMTEP